VPLVWTGVFESSLHEVVHICVVVVVVVAVAGRLSTKFGERAFSFTGPHGWNDLPDELRCITDATTFKKHLKTHFFNHAFN